MSDIDRGIYNKFYGIRRTDGRDEPGQKHFGCFYFVLDTDHDPHAFAALLAYADSCAEMYPRLASDLRVTARQLSLRIGIKTIPPPAQTVDPVALADLLKALASWCDDTNPKLADEARARAKELRDGK